MAQIFKAKTLVSSTGRFSHEAVAPNLVYYTGDQNISGIKNFYSRPTVNGTGVLLSGEVSTIISGVLYSAQINIKNDNGSTIYRGQPVYVSSAAGTNILVKLANNTGEQTSSKTLGLVYQTSLAQNSQGTIVTEGLLEGFNTNAGEEGDPIWLGPTGSLIFGLANKPYAPNHLVYLGVLTRKHANQGEVFVKIQNGFELDELHNVNINHKNILADKNIIRYDSLSGIWFNDTIDSVLPDSIVYNTGDQNISGNKTFLNNINVSGSGVFNALDLNNIDTLSISGVDISITSGNIALTNRPTVNGTGVLLSGEVVNFSLPNTIVYTTGDQTISGVKTFATGVNISGHVGIGINSNNFNLYVRKSPAGVSVNPDSNSIAVFEGSGNSHITVLASDAQTAGVVLGSPTDNFGSYLTWNHDNSALKLGTAKTSGFIQILTNNENEAVRITRSGDVGIGTISPSEKLQVVGNILANNLVYNTGNQTISGTKTFDVFPIVSGNKLITGVDLSSYLTSSTASSTYATITNLNSTGNTLNSSINSLSGTLTGNYLTSSTASSTYATITNLSSTGSTLNNNIISLSGLFTGYTGTLDATFASDIQLANTGSTLQTNINNLSNTYATITNLASTGSTLATNLANTGSTLQTNINNLSGYINSTSSNIVFTTGNQTISGVKSFAQDTTFGDSAQGDFLVISGNNFTVYGSGNFTSGLFVNGNAVLTGVNLTPYATTVDLASTGSNLNTQIENAKKLAIAYAIAL